VRQASQAYTRRLAGNEPWRSAGPQHSRSPVWAS